MYNFKSLYRLYDKFCAQCECLHILRKAMFYAVTFAQLAIYTGTLV